MGEVTGERRHTEAPTHYGGVGAPSADPGMGAAAHFWPGLRARPGGGRGLAARGTLVKAHPSYKSLSTCRELPPAPLSPPLSPPCTLGCEHRFRLGSVSPRPWCPYRSPSSQHSSVDIRERPECL